MPLQLLAGDFIVTVTRSNIRLPKQRIKAKRKEVHTNPSTIIYRYNSFDDVISFSCQASKYKAFFDKYTTLYEYRDNYYIVFRNIKADLSKIKCFCSFASEFGTFVQNSDLFERKLIEYGNKIIDKNVINKLCKKFA